MLSSHYIPSILPPTISSLPPKMSPEQRLEGGGDQHLNALLAEGDLLFLETSQQNSEKMRETWPDEWHVKKTMEDLWMAK